MPDHNILHFAFGSPQRFIAQARRTRDLWAGSYLLSWLCGRAMQALEKKDPGAEFLMPHVADDPLFGQIRDPKTITPNDSAAAYLGSLPTRFSARLSEDADAGACGEACQAAVNMAWNEVAEAVKGIVASKFQNGQRAIWERQTEDFWPCLWVVGSDPALLDGRKRLGTPLPPAEPGLKCTVCGERQELSGKSRPSEAGDWWNGIRELKKIHDLDIGENERLCAVCLVKRLFPSVAESAIGWTVPRFYPSTAYVAAVDWLKQMLDLAKEHGAVCQAAENLIKAVPPPIVSREEARNWSPVRSIGERLAALPEGLWPIRAMSGSVFFEEALRNDDLMLGDKREQAIGALKALQEAVDAALEEGAERARATPFYALLMMDGDNMGALFAGYPLEQQQALARALAAFNGRVAEIVRDHDGWLIYAAGEDVFALLPVSRALRCAHALRRAYRDALSREAPFVPDGLATLSAGVNFAHMNTALGTVVADTHNSLLDGAAKEAAGRDAIACRVWKRGGPILTWAQPWDLCAGGLLPEVVRDRYARGDYSSRFFYKLEGLFRMHRGAGGTFDDDGLRDLLVAEYLACREREGDPKTAAFHVDLLLALCRRWRRTLTPEGAPFHTPLGFSDAGARLARFLQQKEV